MFPAARPTFSPIDPNDTEPLTLAIKIFRKFVQTRGDAFLASLPFVKVFSPGLVGHLEASIHPDADDTPHSGIRSWASGCDPTETGQAHYVQFRMSTRLINYASELSDTVMDCIRAGIAEVDIERLFTDTIPTVMKVDVSARFYPKTNVLTYRLDLGSEFWKVNFMVHFAVIGDGEAFEFAKAPTGKGARLFSCMRNDILSDVIERVVAQAKERKNPRLGGFPTVKEASHVRRSE